MHSCPDFRLPLQTLGTSFSCWQICDLSAFRSYNHSALAQKACGFAEFLKTIRSLFIMLVVVVA